MTAITDCWPAVPVAVLVDIPAGLNPLAIAGILVIVILVLTAGALLVSALRR